MLTPVTALINEDRLPELQAIIAKWADISLPELQAILNDWDNDMLRVGYLLTAILDAVRCGHIDFARR